MTKAQRSPLGHLLLVVALGALAYSNTFQAPFELDDLESIAQNPAIRALANFLPGGPGIAFQPRRWVGYLTFALNYRLGGLDLAGFHLFNLSVHLGAALLVYALVRLTFRTPQLSGSRLAPRAGAAALLAALFFALHPVQTQAVTYIAQRLTSLATFLYLLALVLYAAARLRQEGGGSAGKARLLLTGSVVSGLLAMQTKEIAFTLPLVAALYEASFFRGALRRRMSALLPLLLTLPVVPLGVLLRGGGSVTETAARFGAPGLAQTDLSRLHYLLTQFRAVVTYLRLLVLPVNQNLDYDAPLYTTFFAAPVFFSFLVLVALFSLGVFLQRRSAPSELGGSSLGRDPALRVASFGIFWFFATLSVESSVLPIVDLVVEHRVYLPSVGLAAAAAVGILLLSERTSSLFGGRLPLFASALALGTLAVATYQRNQVWGDSIRLWEDTAAKSPGKARPWYNLGTYLTDGGRPSEAIPALNRALSLAPQNADAWHNLGRAYLMTGRGDEAVRAMTVAVRLKPDLDNAAVNLSAALINTGRHAEAVPLLESVRQRTPDWPEVRLNLGLAYLGSGNLPGALQELAVLQRLAPALAPGLARRIQRAGEAFQGR